jgi:hypothetical protein
MMFTYLALMLPYVTGLGRAALAARLRGRWALVP